MNVAVYWEGNNITDQVISYHREQGICDGVGTFSFEVPVTCIEDFDPWDTVLLYEDGNKKGTYYITEVSMSKPTSTIMIACQDGSKRLTDYFVVDSYFIDYATYGRYWIEKFLVEAGVSYSFNVADQGNLLSNNTTLGVDYAMGIVVTLLKQSGWYMYFDKDGTAIIGTATVNLNPSDLTLTDNDIMTLDLHDDDGSLRNRVVVWGGTGEKYRPYVTASVSTNTPWDIDEDDVRTVVYTHSGIGSYAVANEIAMQILNEFDSISSVKTLQLAGAYDIELANAVSVSNRDVWNGTGIVTTISSQMSDKGLTTTLVLDEKCPRMFGYFRWGSEWVYMGTTQDGIHRKPLDSNIWESYNVGLEENYITDLKVNNGMLICTDIAGNAYRRLTTEYAWTKLSYMDCLDTNGQTYLASGLRTVACAISRATNDFYLGVIPIDLQDNIAWVIKYTPQGEPIEYFQIVANYDEVVELYDIDTDDKTVYATIGKYFGWLLPLSEYYCNYSFTTFGEEGATRGWTSSVSSIKFTSPAVMCNGKCYYWENQLADDRYIRVCIDDHTDPETVTKFDGAWFQFKTNPGDPQYPEYNLLYYDQDNDRVYFAIGTTQVGTDLTSVYYYDVSGASYNFVTSYEHHLADNGSGTDKILADADVEVTAYGDYWLATCSVEYVNWLTGANDELEIENVIMYEETDDASVYSTEAFNSRLSGYFLINTVKAGTESGDNSTIGGGSYTDAYIPKLWVVYFNFDHESLSLTASGKYLLSPNSAYNASDSMASTHSTIKYQNMGGRGSYGNTGPYVCIQVQSTDEGPWVWTGGVPPFELMGHRDTTNPSGSNESPLYGTEFILNCQTGNMYVAGFDLPYLPDAMYGSTAYLTDNDYYALYTIFGSPGPVFVRKDNRQETAFSTSEVGIFLTDVIDGAIYSLDEGYNNITLRKHDRATGQILWSDTVASWNPPTVTLVSFTHTVRENVLALRLTINPGTSYYQYLYFHEFGPYDELTAPAFMTLKLDEPIEESASEEEEEEEIRSWHIIDSTTQPHRLEMSQNSVVSTYAYSGSNRDSIRWAYIGPLNFASLMPDKIVGNWPDPGTASGVYDIRVAKTIPSGGPTDTANIYSMYVGFDSFFEYSPITASGESNFISLSVPSSGMVSSIETSRNEFPSSLFCVVHSGPTQSGGNNIFYQRLSGASVFINSSVSIPGSRSTVLRIDDRL